MARSIEPRLISSLVKWSQEFISHPLWGHLKFAFHNSEFISRTARRSCGSSSFWSTWSFSRMYPTGEIGCMDFQRSSLDSVKQLKIDNQKFSNLDDIWTGMPSLPTLHSVWFYILLVDIFKQTYRITPYSSSDQSVWSRKLDNISWVYVFLRHCFPGECHWTRIFFRLNENGPPGFRDIFHKR